MRLLIALCLLLSINACVTTTACTDQTTQSGLNQCVADKLATSNQILNQQIQKLADIIPDDQSFIEANASWIMYRDAHCSSVANVYSGGSVYNYAFTRCQVELTDSRINRLQSDYKDTIDIFTEGSP